MADLPCPPLQAGQMPPPLQGLRRLCESGSARNEKKEDEIMGVYINMEMPTSCVECRFCDNDAMCTVLGEDLFDHVQAEVAEHIRYLPDDWKCDDCPLVPVPLQGRLIDADLALRSEQSSNVTDDQWSQTTLARCIINAPTIILADPAEEDE